ncbi:MAG: DUF1330 domain-containing protein [Acidimicrobiaceae bacterium]|nr:DUF1330 domain-containing protein [Acidimicrobiaceae bacterium]MYH00010.1 DUF1330 domain-containing protein [Acidimicrobiaceae bacterium]MYL05133.1 DUF1330 domain-containing protein [Acidimicrobiaceae bacterium]
MVAVYFVIVDSEINDPGGLESVSDSLAEMVRAHGGRYLIRGGPLEAKGGDLPLKRMAVVEFESMDQVTALFEVDAFVELREQRSRLADTSAFVVEGV